jgi:hypothetical protein
MNIQDAIDVIESVSGFTDESTPVGEAWKEVLSYIYHHPAQPVMKDANSNKCTTEQQSWECPNMFETGSDFYCVYYSCNICNRTKTLYYDDMK